MSKEEVTTLLRSFSQRPIAYHKIYAQITGSVTGGLFLSQVVYWWFAVQERPFYKTDNEWTEELATGLYELRGAKAIVKALGLISIKRKGIPARSYYTLNVPELLRQISSYGKNLQLVAGDYKDLSAEKPAAITDNTPEITSDKEKEVPQKSLSAAEAEDLGYRLLIQRGVDQEVAKSIIFEQHTPLESIEEAIKNGLAKQRYEGGFTLGPGYIVAALNGARKEGKKVGSTKNSRQFKAAIERRKKLAKRKPPSAKELSKRKDQQIRALGAMDGNNGAICKGPDGAEEIQADSQRKR